MKTGTALREYNRVRQAAWRTANIEKARANRRTSNTKFRTNNPELALANQRAHNQKRRAVKIGSVLEPLSRDTWARLHNDCIILALLTGTPWALDHIIPLARGGKHSEDNLRPLPATLNRIKGARLDHEVTSAEFQSWLKCDGNTFEQITVRSFH